MEPQDWPSTHPECFNQRVRQGEPHVQPAIVNLNAGFPTTESGSRSYSCSCSCHASYRPKIESIAPTPRAFLPTPQCGKSLGA
ncbi:hypothetical protein LIA77_03211 [Sarocladium implicatum]|nr:hypothetical protein LIA77_03211 [Sarocladium implicatum]